MKSIEIPGTLRTELGSKHAARLRREDLVPCVIYGNGEPTHFSTPSKSFKILAYTPDAYIVKVNMGDKVIDCVMKDLQFHPVTDDIIHVDFVALVDGMPTQVELPVKLMGSSRGVRNGGVLKQSIRKLVVKALPENLPDSIDIDITELRIGQSIRVEEVKKEGDFEIMNAPSAVIVGVRTSRKAVAEEDEDEGAEGEAGAEASAEEAAEA